MKAVLLTGIVLCAGLMLNGIYQDHKTKVAHEIVRQDVVQVVDALRSSTTRVTDLTDMVSQGWYLTVVDNNTYITQWFETSPRLLQLRKLVKFFRYGTTDAMYQYRIKQYVGEGIPVVMLQDPQGNVVYYAAGSQLPRDPDSLVNDINTMVLQYHQGIINDCPVCRPRPAPTPAPLPAPAPVPVTPPYVGPPVTPSPVEDSPEISLGALIAIGLAIGAGIGLLHHVTKVTHM